MLEGAFLRCKPPLDHGSVTVSHGAEVTRAYLFIRYFCSALGDKQAPVLWQELGRLNSDCKVQTQNREDWRTSSQEHSENGLRRLLQISNGF